MSKWKCEICNSEFDNYQAQGFNGTIYCPLCYFKELYKREKNKNDKAIEYIKNKARNNCWIDQYESCELIDILRGEDIKEIPQFEGTLEQLDKLSIRGEEDENR